MTPEQHAQIQQRADAAQPGPWSVTRSPYRGGDDPTAQVNVSSDLFDIASDLEDEDAEFIAHARADIPALLAAVRDAQQRAERAEQRAEIAEAVAEMAASDRDEALANEMAADEALARVRALRDEWHRLGKADGIHGEQLRRALDGGQQEAREMESEGFPGMDPEEFVRRFFVDAQGMSPDDEVTRIEWRYLDGEAAHG